MEYLLLLSSFLMYTALTTLGVYELTRLFVTIENARGTKQ